MSLLRQRAIVRSVLSSFERLEPGRRTCLVLERVQLRLGSGAVAPRRFQAVASVGAGTASRPTAVMPNTSAISAANRRPSTSDDRKPVRGGVVFMIRWDSLSGHRRGPAQVDHRTRPGRVPRLDGPDRTIPRYRFPAPTAPHPSGPSRRANQRLLAGRGFGIAAVRRVVLASALIGNPVDSATAAGPGASSARATVALAQWAEHRIVAPKVTGSRPVGHPNA